MVRFSIITPCSRPQNLPVVYLSILEMENSTGYAVEWLIIYDALKRDKRILNYEKKGVPIRQFCRKSPKQGTHGAMLRNIGLEHCSGDYIYYLDDDNLVHPKLFDKLGYYTQHDQKKVLVVNQSSQNLLERRISRFDAGNLIRGQIDTAQFIIPKTYKHISWNQLIEKVEEHEYFLAIIQDAGLENIVWANRIYSYYNYLRRLTP